MGRSGDERVTRTWHASSACAKAARRCCRVDFQPGQPLCDHAGRHERADRRFAGREQAEAESKEQVLESLDSAASHCAGSWESRSASVQKFATPMEQVTTSSLEALKAFSLGEAEHSKFDERRRFRIERAAELDPNFAWV